MTELEKLEQRILEESRRFPEVSFAKLSRIAKHFYDFGKQAGAKWQKEQPDWKPSEEQIYALNSIILNGSFTYVGQVQDLISLKDDLKKL